MKKSVLVLFALCSLCLPAQNNTLSDRVLNDGFATAALPVFYPMADGTHYAAIAGEGKSIVKYDYKTGAAVETLFSIDQTNNGDIKKIETVIWSADNAQALIFAENKYHLYDVKRKQIEPMTTQPNPLFPAFSPDGRMIAFVSNNNLYIKKMDFGTEIAITKDGKYDAVNNGVADELYRIGFGTGKVFEWSADSQVLAFIRFDYKDVAPYRFALSQNDSVPAIVGNRYAQAGGNITKASVQVYDVFHKTTKKINLPEGEELYIPQIRWTQNAEKLAVATLNRFQNTLSLYFANPASTVASLVWQEKSDTFVDYRLLDFLAFLPDNKFVMASERGGFRHLYLYSMNGTQEKQLTSGAWNVTKFLGYNAAKKTFYYQSNESNPRGKDIYSIAANNKKTRLTDGKGTNEAQFSANNSFFVHFFSSLTEAPTAVLRTENGNLLRNLQSDVQIKRATNNKEFFANGYLLKPADFNPNKKYPVLLVCAFDAPQVLDQWTYNWENDLANEGYIIARTDSKATYWNLGKQESADQISTAKYLASLPYVDAGNINLYGEGTGGYMALRALTDGSGVFRSAVAVSPVTDWNKYNAAVSERYLRTPKANASGYKQASLADNTEKVQGKVLLMHNAACTEIPLQHTLEYANALSAAGKLFNMQFYQSKDKHFYRTILEFLK